MTQLIRWLHLSDFHFGTDEYGEGTLSESIIEHIQKRSDGPPDLVFMTGDIAYSGQSEQYEQFEKQVLKPLIDLLGPDGSKRIFIVPGNHDLDRMTHELIARSTLQTKRPRIFDPTEEGKGQRKEIIERFTNFSFADFTDIGGEWIEDKSGVFVKRLAFDELEVGVLGLNTAWFCQDEYDNEQITPGAYLVKEGLKQISDCNLRLVLGHHPLEWFRKDERASIEKLFRENRIVYLHGHMHQNESKWNGWPGQGFLTVQAGAAFQARDDEKWKNRILYAAAEISAGKVWVEPFTWSRKEGWVPEGGDDFPNEYYSAGRWGLPLPTPMISATVPSASDEKIVASLTAQLIIPDGWQLLDSNFIEAHRKPLDRSTALAYYDGRIPSWSIILSSDVPRRTVVDNVVQRFLTDHECDRTSISLLCGAGGEGKTTATMQVAASMIDIGWKVLWRRSEVKGLPKGFVEQIADIPGPWLIVTDDADLIARDLYESALNNKFGINYLLAARDTDWKASMDDAWRWERLPGYKVEVLNGLSDADAQKIVDAWARYGADGLGNLADIPSYQAAQKLALAAQDQDAHFKHEGAFLGAMLKVRKGTDLQEHVASLLERLGARPITNQKNGETKTLRDAMAYIAAMHSENLLFLSKPVLAKVLGCKPGKLKSDVLGPLGEEAAAGSCGKFILTRHRAISETALELLQRRFYYDADELYVTLARAALEIFVDRDPAFGIVPELGKWNFLSDHFFNSGHKELGILIAMNLVDVEPTNAFLISKLAQLYRENELPDKALKVFRNAPHAAAAEPAFFNEWAACEGSSGNYALNAWLDGLCISDQSERRRIDSQSAPITLAGLSYAFLQLSTLHPNDKIYINACLATSQLGLALKPQRESRRNLISNAEEAKKFGAVQCNIENSLQVMEEAISLSWHHRESNLPEWIPSNSPLTYTRLKALFKGSNLANSNGNLL